MQGTDELQRELIQQINNKNNCYQRDRFLELCKLVSDCNEGGWDGRIRFTQLVDLELCPGQLD